MISLSIGLYMDGLESIAHSQKINHEWQKMLFEKHRLLLERKKFKIRVFVPTLAWSK
jgi:hypothetical protein